MKQWEWDKCVRHLRKQGWIKMWKLTPRRKADLGPKHPLYNATGTLYMKFYHDSDGKRRVLQFLLNETTATNLPGNLGTEP